MTEWETQSVALVNNLRRTSPEMASVLHACVLVVSDLATEFSVLDPDTRDKVRSLQEAFESVHNVPRYVGRYVFADV
jgi:hypothetical protein